MFPGLRRTVPFPPATSRFRLHTHTSNKNLEPCSTPDKIVLTMAAAVAVPLSAINGEHGGVLPPSAVVQHSPRHGRSRGMSVKGKSGRGRRYSVVEERDVTIAKALMFVIKRAIQKDEAEDGDDGEYLLADAEGWVSVSDVVRSPLGSEC